MMNFKQWQVINETYGHYNLGIKSPRSVGAVGSKLAEMGLGTDDMADDLSGLPGNDGGLDGMDDMGGGDLGGLGGLGGGLGNDPDGDKIKLDDLHPSLIHLLGLSMHKGAGANGQGNSSFDDEELGGDMGDDDITNLDGDDEGDSPFGGSSSPFGSDSDDDDDDDDSDDDTDGDGESDDTDSDDDNDGEPDESDSAPKDPTKKSAKFMGKGAKCCDKGTMYSKKYMGKSGMKPAMGMEENSFFNSLVNMGRGEVHQKFESGVPASKKRLEPKPGDVGYAPQGRVNTWPSLAEWTKKNKSL